MYIDAFGKAKKVLLCGLDGCDPRLIRKFVSEGKLPTIAKLIRGGAFADMQTVKLPPVTQPAWAAVATGAGPGSTGIHMTVHVPGEQLADGHDGSDSTFLDTETFWNVAEKLDKRVILHNFPCTWPPTLKHGLQVASYHNQPASYVYYRKHDVGPCSLFADRPYYSSQMPGRGVETKLEVAHGWANLPESQQTPLAAGLSVPTTHIPARQYWMVLTGGKDGYDLVTITEGKDASTPVAILRVSEQSDWITAGFHSHEGDRRGVFRFKLLELSPDAKHFRLYASAIGSWEGFSRPEELANELTDSYGPFFEADDVWGLLDGWIDEATYLDQVKYWADWWGNANRHLLSEKPWDVFVTWIGILDHTAHIFKGAIDPTYRHYDAKTAPRYWDLFLHFYELIDINLERMLSVVDQNETLVVLVSDHSHTASHTIFYINHILEKHGFLKFNEEAIPDSGLPEGYHYPLDWSKTKAIEPFGLTLGHIFINLDGRDPGGIVAASDYEAVQEQIIDVLYSVREENSGRCPFQLVVRKQDAEALGVYKGKNFDRIGDILYVMKPGYTTYPVLRKRRKIQIDLPFLGAFSGMHHCLPTTTDLPATFLMCGPGIKPGFARQIPVDIINVAPTVCHMLGMPIPGDAEGSIIWDIMQ